MVRYLPAPSPCLKAPGRRAASQRGRSFGEQHAASRRRGNGASLRRKSPPAGDALRVRAARSAARSATGRSMPYPARLLTAFRTVQLAARSISTCCTHHKQFVCAPLPPFLSTGLGYGASRPWLCAGGDGSLERVAAVVELMAPTLALCLPA